MNMAFHIPKVDMINFYVDPMKFWIFMRTFDYNVGKYNTDEHA